MKRSFLLLVLSLCVAGLQAQVVFTYGNNKVTKDEFLRAYNKNNTTINDKEKSLREYLELYSNFKLKVKAAEELRLDTIAQIQYDIENFRHQVEGNYLSDEKGMQGLMDEAFDRSQKDLHLLHFSIALGPEATAADSQKAFKDINAAFNTLNSGETNYKDVAEKNNVRFADIGFITAFSLPYEYENIAYSLKPGQVSKPYRSKKAWHIFKLEGERKSSGKWKIAQILFTYPPGSGEDVRKATQQKADSVYNLLKKGADFAVMAKDNSDDKITYLTGGELPEFGTGKFTKEFETEVFKLGSDGELTKPFATDFGIHIVKRLGHTPTSTQKENSTLQFDLKQKILQDARISSAKEKFAKEVLTTIGFKRSTTVKDAELFRYADSVSKNLQAATIANFPINNKTIATFKDQTIKGSDWLKFVKEYKSNTDQYKGESNAELWNKFTTISSMDYYKKHLEEYNIDFKYQMKEFKEGNMLFEIMERNVWSRAAADTSGLLGYYNANKTNYKWAASADVIIFNSANEKTAADALEALKKGRNWREITDESNAAIQADSGRYELSQIAIDSTNKMIPAKNSFSAIVKNADGTVTFVKYLDIYPADQQRSFDEAKGLVINDYQNVLEKKWLESLHKKYPVTINEDVVKQILN